MNVYPIAEYATKGYQGAGHAIAAIVSGKVVDLAYFRDLIPCFEPEYVNEYIADPQLRPFIEKWNGRANISVGMCSVWEFCEL